MTDDLVSAYQIWKSEFVDVSNILLPDIRTPEDLLMEKDIFRVLSDEASFLCNLILNTPEEVYSIRYDKLNWNRIYAVCRKKKQWSKIKVDELRREIRRKLKRMRNGN